MTVYDNYIKHLQTSPAAKKIVEPPISSVGEERDSRGGRRGRARGAAHKRREQS